ncbi:MAG: penicillin-binding protein 1C, partial [Rhizobiaceae bacterium]|nr:penicillin-binding protein 1C [Rhizobiaceae bacterium]
AVRLSRADLPVTLRRFRSAEDEAVTPGIVEASPRIVFPPDGARLELAVSGDVPLVLKLQGGRAPFRWLANGRPLAETVRRRTASWRPDGAGASTLTVIDAAGRAASVDVFID